MTAKYAAIWEAEGAVDPSLGARRVVHEIGNMFADAERMQGALVNCEDGLRIPW